MVLGGLTVGVVFRYRRTFERDREVHFKSLEELLSFIKQNGGRAVINCSRLSPCSKYSGIRGFLSLILPYVLRVTWLASHGILIERVRNRLQWSALDELFEMEIVTPESSKWLRVAQTLATLPAVFLQTNKSGDCQ